MPIRINLLAEIQAAEDARRRDPVKRGIWIGGFMIFCVALWSGWLQVDVFQASSALKQQESKWAANAQRYKDVLENYRKSRILEGRLAALDRLSTNRFLWGSALNALQTIQTNGSLEQIQVTHLNTSQNYSFTDGVPAKTNALKRIPPVPAASTEKVTLTIEARDWSNPAEETFNKYKAALSSSEYFFKRLQRRDGFVFSGTVSPPTFDQNAGKFFVSFKVESRFPEVKRNE